MIDDIITNIPNFPDISKLRFHLLRRQTGLSLQQVADQANVSWRSVRLAESRLPSAEKVRSIRFYARMARFYDVPVSFLAGEPKEACKRIVDANNDASDNYFGERLKLFRQRASITHAQLAKTVWLTPDAISKYERGLSMPTIDIIKSFADCFGVSIDDLIGNLSCY